MHPQNIFNFIKNKHLFLSEMIINLNEKTCRFSGGI